MTAFIAALVALILAGFALSLVALAMAGARREHRGRLPARAPGRLAGLARRIFGLYVRRPSSGSPEPRPEQPRRTTARR